MSTMRVEDIIRKKQVPQRYQPNSYRIFSDEIGNGTIPGEKMYSNQAPDIYTQPMIVPAQAIEDRNKPHAGRAAGFLRENARTLNEPVGVVNTRAVPKPEENRWWEWKLPQENESLRSMKKRSSSTSNINKDPSVTVNGKPGENMTTYQKDHGFLQNFSQPGLKVGMVNENQGAAQRHTYNPNGQHAVGIIPINDLNNFSKNPEQPRVFHDKMSFEQMYDARKDNNYPLRGKRQGAYVIEQVEPKPPLGTRNYVDLHKGASVWDAMHLDEPSKLPPVAPARHSAAPMSNEQYRNQRRDPIGYYEDPKFGGPKAPAQQQHHPMASHYAQPPMPLPQQQQQQQPPQQPHSMNGGGPAQDFNPPNEISYQTQQLAYRPSWNGNGAGSADNGPYQNDLLDNAMAYQRPLINGH